jgi:hypothetical protein
MTKRVLILAGLALPLLVFPAATHAEPRVTLYEISERVTFHPRHAKDDESVVIFRHASAPLFGFADLGTPLCPSELLITVPRIKRCTVIAIGTDEVSTVTGIGPVRGTFDVVVAAPGNSKVHVPNMPAIAGTFDGTVDLSPAVISRVPLGSITGNFTITQMADATGALVPVTPGVLPFTGTFRLPFRMDEYGSAGSNQYEEEEAFYLADDLVTPIEVRHSERTLGYPTVRLELRFGL